QTCESFHCDPFTLLHKLCRPVLRGRGQTPTRVGRLLENCRQGSCPSPCLFSAAHCSCQLRDLLGRADVRRGCRCHYPRCVGMSSGRALFSLLCTGLSGWSAASSTPLIASASYA